jgi:hypothetical protein
LTASALHGYMRRSCVSALLTCAALLSLAGPAPGQDSQWWTNQYGNRARLLGGAVIGSSSDLSAVYYNPGGLALVDQPDALLTGYVFELDNLTFSGTLLESLELSSTRFSAVAGLIAGQIPFKFLGSTKLAYSYLTRHNLEYRFNVGSTAPGSRIPGFEGIGSLSASLSFATRLREYWGGLTWSAPLDRFGLGVSTFVANRSQRLFDQTNITAVDETFGVASLASQRSYDYSNWRILWKIGLSTSYERWNGGITITTPSVRLFGDGDIEFENTSVLPGSQSVTNTFQPGVPARYASSWAVGAGGAYSGRDWTGHISVEWFNRVDVTVLDGEPFRSQTDSTLFVDPDVTNVMKGLVNVALGIEKKWSDTYSGYASAYSDFTGSRTGDGSATTTTPWNLWTVGAGAIFSVGRSAFTAGLTYKFGGRDNIKRSDLVPGEVEENLLGSDIRGRFSRLTLVLGFDLEFAPGL